MEHNYTIANGGLILNNTIRNKLLLLISNLYLLLKIILLLGSLLLTMYITFIIYEKCIIEISLSDCIPLGSIFATFGSAVISVFSIYCGEQSKLFEENLSVLKNQVTELSSWQRWPFLKRHMRKKESKQKCNYYMLLNPQITFKTNYKELIVPIPSCTADFKDLPIITNAAKMILFRKQYSYFIFCSHDTKQQTDLFIFDCILMIYKNIIRYKLGIAITYIGSEFIFSSIIFSFYYESIYKFVTILVADF